jgi:membrane fusion protein (multidrug efflux system)
MHLWRWLWTLLFCLVVVGVLGFVKFNQISAAIAFGESFPEPSETVNTVIAQQSDWQPTLTIMGEVVATQSVDIRNELAGMITKVGFTSGAKVQKGQLLLQLDIESEQAQSEALKAQVQINQLDVDRFAELIKSNASSLEQFDRASAQLAVAKANLRTLQTNIAKKTLTAPFDGVAGLHQIEVGAYLAANTRITRLVSANDEVWVDFFVPQEHQGIEVGSKIQLSSSSMLDNIYPANVIALSQEIETDSRNLQVRALWSKPPNNIKPGALVNVSLPISDILNVMRLPNVAIRYDAFGAYVFILNKDEKGAWRASRQAIKVQGNEDNYAIVSSGLKVNDTVATTGSSKLKSGLLVNVVNAEQGSINE